MVVDRKLITSRAPGTAMEFALRLVHELLGPDTVDHIRKPMLVAYCFL